MGRPATDLTGRGLRNKQISCSGRKTKSKDRRNKKWN